MNSQRSLSILIRYISRSCSWRKLPSADFINKNLKLTPSPSVPVEEDTQKLANYVCGTNLFIEGGEDVKLKPDSEYPEWLWEMRSPPPLAELDKNKKTYWNRIKRMREAEKKVLKALQKNSTVHK